MGMFLPPKHLFELLDRLNMWESNYKSENPSKETHMVDILGIGIASQDCGHTVP